MRLRICFILVMMMSTVIGSSLYGMSTPSEIPDIKRSTSRKRAAAPYLRVATAEAHPRKKSKYNEELDATFIAIPSQIGATASSLNTLPSEVLSQVLPHLTSSDGWRLMLTGNKQLCLAMNQREMNLVWKTWYAREKNPMAGVFAQKITSWKGLYRLTLDLQNVFKTLTFDENRFFQQLSQVSPAEGPLHLHVKGLLLDYDCRKEEAFNLFERAASQGFIPAQNVIADALYAGKWGQHLRPAERFIELKAYAEAGWEIAKDYVASVLYTGELGQDTKSKQERFDELKVLAFKGNKKAQNLISRVLTSKVLDQKKAIHRALYLLKFFAPQESYISVLEALK